MKTIGLVIVLWLCITGIFKQNHSRWIKTVRAVGRQLMRTKIIQPLTIALVVAVFDVSIKYFVEYVVMHQNWWQSQAGGGVFQWWRPTILYNSASSFGLDYFGWMHEFGWIVMAILFSVLLIVLGKSMQIRIATFFSFRSIDIANGMMIGGIWGNMYDRIVIGSVRDWIPIPGSDFIFDLVIYNNIADWALTIGCILWIYLLFFKIKTS